MAMPRPHEMLTGPFKLIVRAALAVVVLRAARNRSTSCSFTVQNTKCCTHELTVLEHELRSTSRSPACRGGCRGATWRR